MDRKYRNLTNDLRDGAEFDCRHNVDQNWVSAPLHMHPHFEFYLFIRGNAQLIIEDESFDAHPMDLFIFPPGVLHRSLVHNSSETYERAYFYVTRKALSDMSDDRFPLLQILEAAISGGNFSYHADDESASRIIRLLDDCITDMESEDPSAYPMNRCRVNMLALIVCRIMQKKNVLLPRPPARISDIIRYVNDHLLEPLSIESLSDRFYISKYTLLHDFKDYANISVHQYILYKRILYAQELMRNGVSPGCAAKQSGFNDYTGFYRAFVRFNSVTPQAFYAGAQGKKSESENSRAAL